MAVWNFIPSIGDVLMPANWAHSGAPTSGTSGTLLGVAGKGDQLTDTTNGNLYFCTASSSTSITWSGALTWN